MSKLMVPMAGQELMDALRRLCLTSPPGTAISPERELARQHGVTVAAVRRVMKELFDDGLIVRQQGRGTFVAQRPKQATKPFALYVDMWEDVDHPHHLGIIRGLMGAAPASDLRLEMVAGDTDPATEQRVVETIEAGAVAGLIIPWMTVAISDACTRHNLPVITTASTQARSCYVGPDLASVGSAGRAILDEQGCQRPVGVFVSGVASGNFLQRGEELETWQGHFRVQTKDRQVQLWADEIAKLQPDGLAFDDDVIAAEILAQLGYPELPVVSITDPRARQLPPSAFRLEVDSVHVGQEIMHLMRRLINSPTLHPASYLLRPIRVNPKKVTY